MPLVKQSVDNTNEIYNVQEAMHILFNKLDEAIDDMEQGRVQTLDEAWNEIDDI